MKVLLRADGGTLQGTGHVMRCLSLGQELLARGHDVELMTGAIDVDWLAKEVRASGMAVRVCRPDDIPVDEIIDLQPTWVVIDSYRFDPTQVATLNVAVPVLAVIDTDDRGLDAELYLDQNLGAETIPRRVGVRGRIMSGAEFALVRDAILAQRRHEPWQLKGRRPAVMSFMGGTDPGGASLHVAHVMAQLGTSIDLTLIAPDSQHDTLRALFDGGAAPRILGPTPNLPSLLGATDIVVSAAGTSAWDICALGLPAILVAVADNQRASLTQAVSRGLTLGIDAVDDLAAIDDELGPLISLLVEDEEARRRLSEECLGTFDGKGTERVAARLESHVR